MVRRPREKRFVEETRDGRNTRKKIKGESEDTSFLTWEGSIVRVERFPFRLGDRATAWLKKKEGAPGLGGEARTIKSDVGQLV